MTDWRDDPQLVEYQRQEQQREIGRRWAELHSAKAWHVLAVALGALAAIVVVGSIFAFLMGRF